MILDPVQRRYGYGAARLTLGHPTQSPSLSTLARTSVAREAIFAIVPLLLCGGLAGLLAMTIQLHTSINSVSKPVPLADNHPLELHLWSEATPSPAEPTPAPSIVSAAASPVIAAITTPDAPAPDPLTSEPSKSTFDLASLVIKAPKAIATSVAPILSARDALRPGPRIRMSQSQNPKLSDLALQTPGPAEFSIGDSSSTPTTTPTTALTQPQNLSQRPGARNAGAISSAMQAWSPSRARKEFMMTQAESAGRATTPERIRPPSVSLGGAATEVVRDELSRAVHPMGWQEIPLHELPDCSPAGRQDLLKKRILLAAPFERECSHQDGSYRFVETRNLGAFLMWSRPNPDRPAGQPLARNVCDVLERALRCLDGSSHEESNTK